MECRPDRANFYTDVGLVLGPRIKTLIRDFGRFPKLAFRVTLLLIVLYIVKVFENRCEKEYRVILGVEEEY